MKFLYSHFPLIVVITLLLTACSPHPGTGVWKAVEDNEMGISKLTVGFEGRAEFISSKNDEKTSWHCFWGVAENENIRLDCSPSTNPEQEKSFILGINDQGLAELRDESTLLASFVLSDENPSPKK